MLRDAQAIYAIQQCLPPSTIEGLATSCSKVHLGLEEARGLTGSPAEMNGKASSLKSVVGLFLLSQLATLWHAK